MSEAHNESFMYFRPRFSPGARTSDARHHPPARNPETRRVLDDIHAYSGRVHAVVRFRPSGTHHPLADLLRFFNSLPSPISFRVCPASDSAEVGKQILGM